jgi:peptidyl-prolyl cis-trans isomerase SurA
MICLLRLVNIKLGFLKYKLSNYNSMKKTAVLMNALIIMAGNITGQNNEKERILLEIADKKITVNEFLNVYNKNSNKQAAMDEKSLSDYVELFINFKLKVKEAEARGLDTTEAFINELAGYRRQLAQPYLTDNDVNDHLLNEAYERLKYEINASHILINISETASPKDTLVAFNKIMKLRERISAGEDFASVSQKNSDDPSAKDNGGNLGYFTALQMVYPFETLAYTTPVGSVSMPIRTKFGYHLIKVHDKREARGQVLVAHIMVQTNSEGTAQDSLDARSKAEEIYQNILKGDDFADLTQKFSDDRGSARKGGELPWFGTGRMVPEFENIAFSLNKGEVSAPFQTRFGWHIIKKLDKKELASFDEMKTELKSRIGKDSRSQKSREALIGRIKKEYGLKENNAAKNDFIKLIDKSFADGTWSADKAKGMTKAMFTIGNITYKQNEFAQYLEVRQGIKDVPANVLIDKLYKDFVEDKLIAYEDSQLENKYPEFRALMQEYRDGILLFELTDKEVWSKAVNDTAGLENHYEQNKTRFMWDERLNATIYTASSEAVAKKVRKLLKQADKKAYTKDDILKQVNTDSQLHLRAENGKFAKGENEIIDAVKWIPGIAPDIKRKDQVIIVHVHEKIPPQPKTLREARGLVTADYQTHLEKNWIESLKQNYSVTLHKEILSNLK